MIVVLRRSRSLADAVCGKALILLFGQKLESQAHSLALRACRKSGSHINAGSACRGLFASSVLFAEQTTTMDSLPVSTFQVVEWNQERESQFHQYASVDVDLRIRRPGWPHSSDSQKCSRDSDVPIAVHAPLPLRRMAWTERSGTRQESRLSWQITGSLRDLRYNFSLSPRSWGLRRRFAISGIQQLRQCNKRG